MVRVSCDIETLRNLNRRAATVILKDGPVETLTAVMMQYGRSIASLGRCSF